MRYCLLLLTLLGSPLLGIAQALTNAGATLRVQAGTVLYVAGGVQNASGATFSNAGTLQLTGDLTNAGTLASPGTLLFSGAQDQTFTPGSTASVTTLTLRNTGATGANRLFLAGDLGVESLLALKQGLVRTQGSAAGGPLYTLSLPDGARVEGEAAGQYVQGRLAVTRQAVSAVDFSNGLVLSPNGQNLGPVTVTRTAGLQTAGVSYGTNTGGTAKGIDRVWQVVAGQPPSTAAPASVLLSWVTDDDNGFTPATPAQLWRADQATGPWTRQDAPANAGTTASARTFTANVTQLGVLTVSNTSQPLPVTLVAFTAERQGADGLLRWTTASELNNAYFVVESSADGTRFQALGRVAGAGTSSQAHAYQFVDATLARYASPAIYYRLRQVDADGAASYLPVRAVPVPAATGWLVQAYPNPSTLAAAVAVLVQTERSGEVQLTLTDALGRLVGQQAAPVVAGSTSLALTAAPNLAAGVYVLHVRQGPQQQSIKLVRQ